MTKNTKTSDPRVPGWIWLLTGVALGALITLLMRLSEMQPVTPATPRATVAPVKTEKDNAVSFNFYKLLRDTEIVVPERKDADLPQVDADSEYLLQVASFRALDDAQQARAELMLLNLDARIEKADVGKGETWHRVIVGPFGSRSQLSKARNTLISNRFEALVLKRKKTG